MAQEKAYKDQFSVEKVSEIAKIVNRYYQEVAITKISGTCPYGHKEGEKFRVTSVNHDGLCGALYQAIHPCIASMHYGGGVVWEKDINVVGGVCPEMGRVQVEVKRFEKEPTHLKTKPAIHGACPDLYNQVSFRLVREKR